MDGTLAYRLADGIGYLTHDEIDLIHQVAKDLPQDAVCLNVGTGAATSIIALLEVRPELHVHCVDINVENGLSQFREANIVDNITQHIGASQTMTWAHGSIDYAFIDGGHLKAEIQGDIANWMPHMKKGGVILFHDYGGKYWSDVKTVVDAWAKKKKPIGHADTLIAFRV